MNANTHNGHELLPVKSRLSPGRIAAKAVKKHDRADFRLRTVRTFEEVGRGMGIFDAAIATIYVRGKRVALINLVLWVILVAYLVWTR